MSLTLTDDELRVEVNWHTHPLDQITETAHEWVLGTWTLSKSNPTWRSGYGHPVLSAARFRTYPFELDGRQRIGLLFESGDEPAWIMVGWVQPERAAEAQSWVEFLNSEMAKRLAGEPAGKNWTYIPADGSAAMDYEDQLAMERHESLRGMKPPKWWDK